MPPALPEASFLCKCSDLDQLVLPRTDADLLAVLQTAVPVRIRVDALEVVMLVDMTRPLVGGGAAQGRRGTFNLSGVLPPLGNGPRGSPVWCGSTSVE